MRILWSVYCFFWYYGIGLSKWSGYVDISKVCRVWLIDDLNVEFKKLFYVYYLDCFR